MNILIYPSSSSQPNDNDDNTFSILSRILTPSYTVQKPPLAVFRSPNAVWRTSCKLLVFLPPPLTTKTAKATNTPTDGDDVDKEEGEEELERERERITTILKIENPTTRDAILKFVNADGGSVLLLGASPRYEKIDEGSGRGGQGGRLLTTPTTKMSSTFSNLSLFGGDGGGGEGSSVPLKFTLSNAGGKGGTITPVYPASHAISVDDRWVDLKTPDGEVFQRVSPSRHLPTAGIVKDEFVAPDGAQILARYDEGSNEGSSPGSRIAGLVFSVGKGKVGFCEPTLGDRGGGGSEEGVEGFIKYTLKRLGLEIPSTSIAGTVSGNGLRQLPQVLVSAPAKPWIVSRFVEALDAQDGRVIEDANDSFCFHHLETSSMLIKEARSSTSGLYVEDHRKKHIIAYLGGSLPTLGETPLFNLRNYFTALDDARKRNVPADLVQPLSWGIGEALLYGEVVTSTQTMLDKNPKLLNLLPTPLVSLASYQLSGRGRGANVWLSPVGCLQFSVLLRVDLIKNGRGIPANKLVFVQYLFALAVVEACRDETVLGEKRGERVRIKWPNDLYVVEGEERERNFRKVGGILVNTNFAGGGRVDVIIGCGLNLNNPPPIASLDSLLPHGSEPLSAESVLAAILARFEKMWLTFVAEHGSFESFMDRYLSRWLHSDQVVTLTTETPHRRVRIAGITTDHGLLRTIPEEGLSKSDYIDLQPDGNSFDIMAGLIKVKQRG